MKGQVYLVKANGHKFNKPTAIKIEKRRAKNKIAKQSRKRNRK